MANYYYYNGVLLPEIPSDYPYGMIMESNTLDGDVFTHSYILCCFSDNDIIYAVPETGGAYFKTSQQTDVHMYWLPDNTTEWEYVGKDSVAANITIVPVENKLLTQEELIAKGLDWSRIMVWSNFDIPQDSIDSTAIYFNATDPVPYSEKKYSIKESTMKAIADSIRGKTGETGVITPTNMPSVISDIKTEPKLQDKTITENGVYSADSGFDGLGSVTVQVGKSGGSGLLHDFPTLLTDVFTIAKGV